MAPRATSTRLADSRSSLILPFSATKTPEKEFVDDASSLARLRGELVLSKGLLRRVDHDFDIFQVHVGIEFANEAEEPLDGFPTFVPPRQAEALEIGHLEGAIVGEHLRGLLRIPKRCRGELLQQLFCVLHV